MSGLHLHCTDDTAQVLITYARAQEIAAAMAELQAIPADTCEQRALRYSQTLIAIRDKVVRGGPSNSFGREITAMCINALADPHFTQRRIAIDKLRALGVEGPLDAPSTPEERGPDDPEEDEPERPSRATIEGEEYVRREHSGPYPGCHSPEQCNKTGRCPRDPVCFN